MNFQHQTHRDRPAAIQQLTRLLWVLFALFCGTPLQALETTPRITIDSETFRTTLNKQITYYEDTDRDLSVEQARELAAQGRFILHKKGSLQFGYKKGAYWLHFKARNTTGQKQAVFLEARYPPLDDIQVYWYGDNASAKHQQGGDHVPYAQRDYPVRHHLFAADLENNVEYDVFVRVRTESSYSLPLYLATNKSFITYDHYTQWALGLYYGIALGLIAYNLFLFLAVRDRIYLHYNTYVAFTALFMASIDGLLYPLWPDNPDFENHFLYVSIWTLSAFLLSFCRLFLHTRQDLPRIDKIIAALQWLFFLGAAIFFFAPVQVAARANSPVILLGALGLFIFSFYRYFQGFKPASYFVFGMGCYLAGVIAIAAGSLNLFSEYDWAPTLMKVGSAIELFCFSIGLGSRINTLKAQEAASKQEARIARAEALARAAYGEKMELVNKELALAVQARSDFLANMSHEIRTPMNGVLGMLELVKDTPLTQEQSQYLEVAHRSGTTLLTLINDILDLSKIESGKLDLESMDFSLKQLLDDLQSLFTLQIQDKGLYFRIHYAADLPEWIRGDRTRVWQVLTNLCGNAVKFTREGGVTISASRDANNDLLLAVTDTGIGIPPLSIAKIFESFTQADSSTTRKFGGTGLGLTITKRLAQLMEGDISVTSELGIGSTFTARLRLPAGAPPTELNGHSDEQLIKGRCDGLHVLLVEDNAVNQQVAKGMLKRLGVTVDIANDGIEALEKSYHHHYDLILMDVQMPRMDGYECARRLREHRDRNYGVPIIAMTANAMEGDREACLRAGMSDYMTKPIQKEMLQGILLKWRKAKAA